MTIAWDQNSDGITAGYYVYYGTQSGNYSGYVDVKNSTSAVMNAADSTATYYFAVQAYSATGDKSQLSAELSWKPTTTTTPTAQSPTLQNPGSMTATVGQSVTVQLIGTDPGGLTLKYSATGLPPGLAIASTGSISGAPSTAGAYNVTATVTNSANLSASQLFTWTVLAPATGGGGTSGGGGGGNGNGHTGGGGGGNSGGGGNGNGNGNGNTPPPSSSTPTPTNPMADLTPPTVTITSPTMDPLYLTEDPMVILTGTAADNVGVVNIMWTNSRGGVGTTLGTYSWATTPIELKMGDNVITITAADAAGNIQSVTLTITRYQDLQNHVN